MLSLVGVLLSSCSKDDDSASPSNNTSTELNSSTTPTFSATINGNVVTHTIDNQNLFETYGSSGSIGDSSFQVYSADFSKLIGTDYFTVVGISKGTLGYIGGFNPDTAEFSNFFNAGTYAFSDDAKNGIELIWYDSNDVRWTSTGANQTGSSFVIEKKITYNIFGYYYVKYKAKFNCKLTNGTQTVNVTNGTVIGTFSL